MDSPALIDKTKRDAGLFIQHHAGTVPITTHSQLLVLVKESPALIDKTKRDAGLFIQHHAGKVPITAHSQLLVLVKEITTHAFFDEKYPWFRSFPNMWQKRRFLLFSSCSSCTKARVKSWYGWYDDRKMRFLHFSCSFFPFPSSSLSIRVSVTSLPFSPTKRRDKWPSYRQMW